MWDGFLRNIPVLAFACLSCSPEAGCSSCSCTFLWAWTWSPRPAQPAPSRWKAGWSAGCGATSEVVCNGKAVIWSYSSRVQGTACRIRTRIKQTRASYTKLSNSKVKFPQVSVLKRSYYEIDRSWLNVSNYCKVSGHQDIANQVPKGETSIVKPYILSGIRSPFSFESFHS